MDDGLVMAMRHRLGVDAYFRMGEAGVFAAGERVELIGGDIIDMAPIGQEHEGVVNGVSQALMVASLGRAIVSTQNSVRLDMWTAPQPDVAVLRYRADFYMTGERAGVGDVLLLVEVADSSLAYDRGVKVPLYARAGVGEVWVVDVRQGVVEVYRGPEEGGYRGVSVVRRGDEVALAMDEGILVRLDVPLGS